jgi:hypothetical protein
MGKVNIDLRSSEDELEAQKARKRNNMRIGYLSDELQRMDSMHSVRCFRSRLAARRHECADPQMLPKQSIMSRGTKICGACGLPTSMAGGGGVGRGRDEQLDVALPETSASCIGLFPHWVLLWLREKNLGSNGVHVSKNSLLPRFLPCQSSFCC